jgi:hypothetical protein
VTGNFNELLDSINDGQYFEKMSDCQLPKDSV